LLKFVWPERYLEIISLSWVRGLMIVMLTVVIVNFKLVTIKHLPKFFKHFFIFFNTVSGSCPMPFERCLKVSRHGLLLL